MSSFLVELEHMKAINVSGPQRDEYLHGQITINTKSFDPTRARFAAHCDFKGKMWSTFFISQFNESYHLLMSADSAEQSLIQLKKYGVFSKVDIDILDDRWRILGGSGEQLAQDLSVLFPKLTDEHLSYCANEFGGVITFNDQNKRYLMTLSEKGYARMQEIAVDYISADSDMWSSLEIAAGIGLLTSQTIGEFVPQMFNLQALNGIDFDKGCYMGQEVVARTKFLGKNKRALFILESLSSNDDEIRSADVLEKPVGENWRRGGAVINSASVNGKTSMLAVLANDSEVGDVLRLKSSPASKFEIQALPYTLD